MPFPDYAPTVPEFIRTRCEQFGDHELILLGDERITYNEAAEQSARLAKGLLASGFGKGSRVGVLMPNGPGWVVAWLAASRIGAIVVPINTFYKPRELGWVMRHADLETLLTVAGYLNNDYLGRLETVAPGLAGQKADRLLLPELPYLRSVLVCWTCVTPAEMVWGFALIAVSGSTCRSATVHHRRHGISYCCRRGR